jgi:hypothetical protein
MVMFSFHFSFHMDKETFYQRLELRRAPPS